MNKEEITTDLEAAAKLNLIKYIFDESVNEAQLSELKKVGIGSFIDGAEWMARQGYVVEDEIAMCYNNGESIGLSLYNFDIDNNTIGLKDGDKVIIQVRKNKNGYGKT